MSKDGRHAATLIAFVGSVFSPYYKFRRRHEKPNPENYCAINMALYGKTANRWSMTERDSTSLERTPHRLTIGPSELRWEGKTLIAEIDEIAAPLPRRIKGTIRLSGFEPFNIAFDLSPSGNHIWWPIATRARVEVDFKDPALSWTGHGYIDSNQGDEPLENAFESWDWSRSVGPAGGHIFYDVRPRCEQPYTIALATTGESALTPITPPAPLALAKAAIWRMPRATRADNPTDVAIVRTLEDTPFYSRSLLRQRIHGETCWSIHESLSLDRFNMPVVQAMLPFRMPRSLFVTTNKTFPF